MKIFPDISALRTLIFVTTDSEKSVLYYYYLNIITYSTPKHYFYHYINNYLSYLYIIDISILFCFIAFYYSI